MNFHFLILVIWKSAIERYVARTEVDSSRRQAWAFARLSYIGVCRYLRLRRRCELSTFLFFKFKYKAYNSSLKI